MSTPTQFDFSRVPAKAMRFDGAAVTVGSNGDKAKTAPVTMLARSAQPIDHWYWGKVVHDMAGMTLSKPKQPIDYCHNTDEVLGYANKFDTNSDGLTISGALTPFKDGDRANEVIFKSQAGEGVPYEASIDFSGVDCVIENVPTGFTTQVNGYAFDGPGIVIRQWTLRGVAICPYGADPNTSTLFSDAGSKFFTVTPKTTETSMSTTTAPAGAAALSSTTTTTPAGEPNKGVDPAKLKDGQKPAEGAAPAALVDASKLTGKPAPGVDPAAQKFINAFGDKGATMFCTGVSFEDGAAQFIGDLKTEHAAAMKLKDEAIAGLNTQLDAAKVLSGNQTLPSRIQTTDGQKDTPAVSAKLTQATGSDGLARFAAGLKLGGKPKADPAQTT